MACWIDYWWSPAVTKTDWGKCPDTGWVRPQGLRSLVEYQPLLYKGARFAHLNVRASPTRDTVKAVPGETGRTPIYAQGPRALVGGDSEAVRTLPEAAD
jgi:hypothetical protein